MSEPSPARIVRNFRRRKGRPPRPARYRRGDGERDRRGERQRQGQRREDEQDIEQAFHGA